MESRWSVQVQGPMGPGRPEGDSPVTTSGTRASEIGAWRADGRPVGECTRPRRPQYGNSYYTGERRPLPSGVVSKNLHFLAHHRIQVHSTGNFQARPMREPH